MLMGVGEKKRGIRMDEEEQNKSLDELIDKCPLFNNYVSKFHNVTINYGKRTISEIDDLYVYESFVLLGENKRTDSPSCHKKMVTQIKRFRRYENLIARRFGTLGKQVYYFYAHFDNDKVHIEYLEH